MTVQAFQQRQAEQQAREAQNNIPAPPPGGSGQMGGFTVGQDDDHLTDAMEGELFNDWTNNPGGGGSPDQGFGGAIAGAFDPSKIGSVLGEGFNDFTNAWDNANGAGNQGFHDFLSNPRFEGGSLMQDVGQNMTSMMDPGAWEQMARNRLAAANDASLASLNEAERRMNDRSSRSGLASNLGMQGQMYKNHADRAVQSERDIFNDVLSNQMGAIGQAGQFALGAQGQDIGRWQSLLGQSTLGAQADLASHREDNPSGAAVLGDLLGAGGQAAGMGAQGMQGILSLLTMGLL